MARSTKWQDKSCEIGSWLAAACKGMEYSNTVNQFVLGERTQRTTALLQAVLRPCRALSDVYSISASGDEHWCGDFDDEDCGVFD
jgi:DNA transposition AAA+ family ATPase